MKYLAAFRRACLEAAKWDYKTARERNFNIKDAASFSDWKKPKCPHSAIAWLDEAVKQIGIDGRSRYAIQEMRGNFSRIHWLLTAESTGKADIC